MFSELAQNVWVNEPWLLVIGGTFIAAIILFLIKFKLFYLIFPILIVLYKLLFEYKTSTIALEASLQYIKSLSLNRLPFTIIFLDLIICVSITLTMP